MHALHTVLNICLDYQCFVFHIERVLLSSQLYFHQQALECRISIYIYFFGIFIYSFFKIYLSSYLFILGITFAHTSRFETEMNTNPNVHHICASIFTEHWCLHVEYVNTCLKAELDKDSSQIRVESEDHVYSLCLLFACCLFSLFTLSILMNCCIYYASKMLRTSMAHRYWQRWIRHD